MLHNNKKLFEQFPSNYINDINGWGFSKKEIRLNKGKLLTLDIDYGLSCSLNCPLCFRKGLSSNLKNSRKINKTDFYRIINEAKELGIRSVKFLGAGEPFENKDFIEILEFLRSKNIIPLVFTNGTVLGDDLLARKYFSHIGIDNSKQLVGKIKELDVSIMLKYNSSEDDVQNKLVGCTNGYNYSYYRNIALKNLIDFGFNDKNYNPTRLALAVNPITQENISEAFEIYKWARLQNIYAIVTPTMISGRAGGNGWHKSLPSKEEIIKLYTKINDFNISVGISSIEQLKNDGISAYAGGHPCNQVACGLYISLNGTVFSCPGDDTKVEGNIWENSVKEIWNNSQNRLKRSGRFNCNCIAKDGKSIPKSLYVHVLSQLNHSL